MPTAARRRVAARPRPALALALVLLAAVTLAVAVTNAATPSGDAFSSITWRSAASQPQGNSEAQGEVVGGKLYVFGGFDALKPCCTPTSRAYSYDPAEDVWTPLAQMPGQKADGASTATPFPGGVTHAAFANDGRYVFWAGGYIANASGGQTFGTNEVWRYDTQTNAYAKLANLPKRTAGAQAEVVDGVLHVFGGTKADTRDQDFDDHFTLALGTTGGTGASWVTRADSARLVARHHMGSAVLGTKIYAVGGQVRHDEQLQTLATVQVFDTANAAAGWQTLAPLPSARGHVSSSTFAYGGRIFVIGGETAHGAHIADVAVFDPAAGAGGTWSASTPLPAPRVSGVAGAIGGRLLFTTGGGSATTVVGAPTTVPGGCLAVSELPCAQVKANLPLRVDFTGAEGGLYDAQGQDVGLTMVQPSTGGAYRPERLDVTGGALRLRTTAGINYRSATTGGTGAFNALDNGLGVGVDATRPLRVAATVVRPALGSGAAEQAAVWFGPDQDNHVKVDLASSSPSAPYHRPQIVWEVNGVPSELNLDGDLTRNHSSSTVELVLETDPVARTVTGAIVVDGGGRQVIGTTAPLPASWFASSTAAQGSGYAGLFATHRNRAASLGALTYSFSDFSVTDLTPSGDAPNMVVRDTRVVLSDPTTPAGGVTRSVTVENTGAGPLTLTAPTVADDPAEAGDDATHWSAAAATATIAAGATGTVDATFTPTTTGVKGAIATIRSNDPDEPTAAVKLRGLAHPAYTGSNEPSLQRILDTWEIPVTVGDTAPDTNAFDGPNPAVPAAGEVAAQRFERAGTGAVSVEPLAIFGPDGATPLFTMGTIPAGTPGTKTEVFRLPNDPASPRESQRLDVPGGIRTFDPGSAPFSLYSTWPFFGDRQVFGEDALNTFDGANRHKVRVYPFRTPAGLDVPDAYVVAIEETTGTGDYQDLVYVVRNVRPVTRTASGEVGTENLDEVPFPDRLVMNRIQNPETGTRCRDSSATGPCTGSAAYPVNGVHDQATLRVRNTSTTEPLTVSGLALSDTAAWQLVDPPALPRELAPGASVDVTVKFVAQTPSGNPANRQFDATLSVLTSDADEPSLPVQLSGMWQRQSEGGVEPDVAQIVRSFGYGTTIVRPGEVLNNSGQLVKIGDEVHSRFWKRADTTKPAVVRQLAAFHTQGNTASFRTTPKTSSTLTNVLTHYGVDGQSYLPRKNDASRTIGKATFSPADVFNINIDGENTDWTRNNQAADVDCQTRKQTDPTVVCGHHVRTFPVEDRLGRLVKNSWIVVMDYSGINYDFNDNVYLVDNVRPELDADDPATPKPCSPVACEQIAVGTPFTNDFSATRTPGYVDRDDQATGFTYVLPTTNGTGYVKPNLDLDTAAGRLDLTTTRGITVNNAGAGGRPGNSQDNMLSVGLKWPATVGRQMLTTRLVDVPATPAGLAEQGGLWFGSSEDDLVKLHLWSGASGQWVVEAILERGGVIQAPVGSMTAGGVRSPVVDVAGRHVDLKLTLDPASRRVSAYYQLEGGPEQLLATFLVPAAFFSADPAAITDERIGTSSFAGIHGSNRNSDTPLRFSFDRFGVEDDATLQRPRVTAVRPAPGATGVALTESISTDLDLPNGGVDAESIKPTVGSVRLLRVSDGQPVAGSPGTSGGFDTISFAPSAPLAANTQYRFEITSDAKDQSGASFEPFSSTFTTGSDSAGVTEASFDKLAQATATAPKYTGFTSLAVGPDRKLYGLRNDGLIQRWAIGADGALGQPQTITTLQSDGPRLGTGLVFDPAATASDLVVWVSHSTLGFDNMPDWGGKITKLSGADLQQRQDVVTNLPRSAKDHLTNGVEFGPDGNLYFPQGSNSAMGRLDGTWRNRKERLLTAAVLKLDPRKLPAQLPIDAKTEELAAGQSAYDPFAPNAPLTIHATGVRNAFDLVWHSNGSLYVPTNGSAAGGNTPAAPSPLPASCAKRIDGAPFPATASRGVELTNVQQTMPDWLFRVVPGGYYGHPNPERCEWVLNGGNPTSADDKGQVGAYPVGTQPDPNWRRDQAYSLGLNKSPNGVTEYRSDLFGGSLKGKVLVVHYSNDNDVFAYTPGPDGEITGSGQVVKGAEDFIDPLDVVEDRQTGNLYVAQYDQLGADVPKVFLMRARTSTQPTTDCPPYSTLPCAQVKVATDPAHEPRTGGLVDKDGQGTGFTMVQPNGPNGDTPAYRPQQLDQDGERLTITATNGIQYKSATTGGSGAYNALDNGLGVGVGGDRELRLETTVVDPPLFATASSEQGGLWIGPDQDNYVKLVVAAANVNGVVHHRVQLLREQAGVAGTTDEVNAPAAPTAATAPSYVGQRVRLILEVDPATKVAEAWFQVGTGAVQRVGQLTVSDAIVDGSRVAATQRAFGIGTYAGVFATKRFNTGTAPVTFAFEDTSIGEAVVANRAPQVGALADRTDEQGTPVRVVVSATDPDGDTPLAFAATGLPDGVTIDAATGVISGTPTGSSQEAAEVTVTVTDPDGLAGTESFRWTITPPFVPALDGVKVNFTKKTGASVVDGYRNDAGQPYGDRATDLRYGWVGVDEAGGAVTHEPLDLSVGGSSDQGNGRERNLVTDERLDSLMHMQGDDVLAFELSRSPTGSFNGTPREGAWELALADGRYDVTVAAGDPSAFTSGTSAPEAHFVRVESVPAWPTPFVPPATAGTGRTRTATLDDVEVTDGRLTVDAIGGTNTKLLFVEVQRVANQPPVLEPIADRTGREGDVVELAVAGTDPDAGETLTYTATGLPAGLTIDAATGAIGGTIAAGASAGSPHAVTVTVTDSGRPALTASRSFAWTVAEGDAPVVDAITPAADATEVATDAVVTARFSEAVTGVDETTFTLRRGDQPVPAAVTYDEATRTATLDPSAALDKGATYTASVASTETTPVRDAAGNALVPRTWSFATETECQPHSPLSCERVRVDLPRELTFDGGDGGLLGTGFTMSQPKGQDGFTLSSYRPELLSLTGGLLNVRTTIGIQFKSKTTGGTADYNLLDNGLGVGFAQPGRVVRYETVVVPPSPAGNVGAEQAGIWVGPDQDNLVKLVVANTARQWKVQLAKEVGGAVSSTALVDELNTGAISSTATPVRLVLEIDPRDAGSARAWYQVGAGAVVPVAQSGTARLALSPAILDGSRLPSALTARGITQTAGLFATKRGNATGEVTFGFDEWSVRSPNTAPVVADVADVTAEAGTRVELGVSGTDAEGDAITWSATGLPGDLAIDAATGVITGRLPAEPGSAAVTVRAAGFGDLADEDTFALQWTAPPAPAGLGDGVFVDFADATGDIDPAYVRDAGAPYGDRAVGAGTQRFGWVRVGSSTPLDLSVGGTANAGNGRTRTACTELPVKDRSLMHMQGDDPVNFNGTPIEGAWELAVPDGLYDVKVAVGDPNAGADPETDVVNAEGVRVVGPNTLPTTGTCVAAHQVTGAVEGVRVRDGRLTLDAVGGRNTKILWVDVTPSANRVPVIAPIADRATREGATVDAVVAAATDPDGDAVTVTGAGLPAGLTMDADGRVSGTVTAPEGDYVTTVSARDARGAEADPVAFTWSVTDGTAPAVVATVPADGATGAAVEDVLSIEFDEAIDATGAQVELLAGLTAVPADVAAAGATLTIDPVADLAPETAHTVRVSGIADAAGNVAGPVELAFTTRPRTGSTLTASEPELAFGPVAVGGQAERTVTLANTSGERTISVGSVRIGGEHPTQFADDQADPFELAPGQTRTVTVTFAPSSEGDKRALLRVEHDGANGALAVPLSGTGADRTPWRITAVTPAAGATGVALGTTVTATFDEAMGAATITDATFELRDGTTPVAATVAYDATTRTATLTPAEPLFGSRTYTAVLENGIRDAAGNAPTIDRSWSFTTRAPDVSALEVSAGSLAFGEVRTDATAERSVTVRNAGGPRAAAIAVAAIGTTGGDAAQFTDDATGPFTLAPGAERTVTVTFAPATAGPKGTTLRIAHDGTNGPTDVALTGTGVASDTTAPEVSLTGAPPATSDSRDARFAFVSSEPGGRFACQLDDGAVDEACTSPKAYTGLALGEHAFRVRAYDAAGNASDLVTYLWEVVEEQPAPARPTVRVNAGGPAQTVGTATWLGCATTGRCVQEPNVTTVAGAPTSASSATVGGVSAPANAAVYATAFDGPAGSAGSRAVGFDVYLPNGRYDVLLHFAETTSANRSFDVNVDMGATEVTNLDVAARAGGRDRALVVPVRDVRLADGKLDVDLLSRGNGRPFVNGFEVVPVGATLPDDTTKPVTTITGGPAAGSTQTATEAQFSFTANEPGRFECSLDGAAFTACTSPKALTGLGAGQHTFGVRAVDTAGNVGDAASRTWTVASTTPDPQPRQGTRVNVGGPAVTALGTSWLACPSATSCAIRPVPGYGAPFSVASTNGLAPIYGTGFTGPATATAGTRTIAFDAFVPNGRYDVRVHVAELRGQAARFTLRVDDGAPRTVDFTSAGSRGSARVEEFAVDLTDGKLDVDAFHGAGGAAFINAIELLPVSSAPDRVGGFTVVGGDREARLSWTRPASAEQVRIVRTQSGVVTSPSSGTLVYEGTGSSYTDTGLTNGTTYRYTAFSRSGDAYSAPVDATVTPAAPASGGSAIRVNAAAGPRTAGGVAWLGCTSTGAGACGGGTMTGGFAHANPNADVRNPVAPADAQTYRNEWTGGQTNGVPAGARAFGWAIGVPNGRYAVRLHFADHNQRVAGARVFDVDVEGGEDELPGFDIVRQAGGPDRAIVREVVVDVADGQLNVDFIRRVENAMVNAIEVVPVAGGVPATVATAPAVSTAASTTTRRSGTLRPLRIPALLKGRALRRYVKGARPQAATWSGRAFTLSLPVRDGRYRIALTFAEPVHRAARRRLFDVAIERARPQLRAFDVFAAAGRRGRPITRAFRVRVTDGAATVRFRARRDRALVNAVTVTRLR